MLWRGEPVSWDFYKEIPGSIHREWFECRQCAADLRAGKHSPECLLTPADQQEEIERVRFIIKQHYRGRGVTIRNGGKSDE